MKFKCKQCGKILNGGTENSGQVSECPSCGCAVKIPFPGIGVAAFWGYWVLIVFCSMFTSAIAGEGAIIFGLFVFFPLLMHVKYLRVLNMGMNPWWTLAGLIPFSFLWLGCAPTRARKAAG